MKGSAPSAHQGRGTLENTLLMALSQAIRLASGVVLFVVLARIWGPEAFGTFTGTFVLTSLITLVVDYGFGLQLVRDIGESPRRAAELTGRAFQAKMLLTSGVLVVSALVGCAYLRLPEQWALYGLLLGTNVLLSFAQFFCLPLRALDRFALETKLTLVGTILVFGAVLPAVLLGAGPIQAAVAFLAARSVHVSLAWSLNRRVIPDAWPRFDWQAATATLGSGLPFGLHLVLAALYFQVDTLLIQYLLGAKGVGIYQAGFRLLAGGQILAEALGNAYLPRLARSRNAELRDLATAHLRQVSTVGLIGFVALSAGAPWLVALLYGREYQSLIGLLPLFGVVLAIRHVGSAWGMLLTVSGRQMVRVLSVAIALIASISFNLLLVPGHGLLGALWASILTHLILNGIYVGYVWLEIGSLALSRRSLALAGIGLIYGLACWLLPLPAPAVLALGSATILTVLAVGIERDEWRSLYIKFCAGLAFFAVAKPERQLEVKAVTCGQSWLSRFRATLRLRQ